MRSCDLAILTTAQRCSHHTLSTRLDLSRARQSIARAAAEMMTSCVGASVDIDGRDLDLFVARRWSVTHTPIECTVATRLARAQAVRRSLTAVESGRSARRGAVGTSNTASSESLLIILPKALPQRARTG